jgi:hypothetical protein
VCLIVAFSPAWLPLLIWAIRRWNSRPTDGCPRCGKPPPVLDVRNHCWNCECEYDKWGNLLKEADPPDFRNFDLARFATKQKPQTLDIEPDSTGDQLQ